MAASGAVPGNRFVKRSDQHAVISLESKATLGNRHNLRLRSASSDDLNERPHKKFKSSVSDSTLNAGSKGSFFDKTPKLIQSEIASLLPAKEALTLSSSLGVTSNRQWKETNENIRIMSLLKRPRQYALGMGGIFELAERFPDLTRLNYFLSLHAAWRMSKSNSLITLRIAAISGRTYQCRATRTTFDSTERTE